MANDDISATDIITYIGVPLAVLGVLPILYTFFLSILTQRRIRHRLLQHGHKPQHGASSSSRNNHEGFMLRASPMTSLIEVEMPRYTIAPVERVDSRYWSVSEEAVGVMNDERVALLNTNTQTDRDEEGGHEHGVGRVESTLSMIEEGRVRGFLRGGSWRTFHWRRLVVGRKLYRIQYEDELREPPAEIDFADLVNFLMDWGAELDGMGWEKLRNGGLWTPAGTVLLRVHEQESDGESSLKETSSRLGAGGSGDWVLRTSMPDDSDGILTLCVRWPPGGSLASTRDATSLPPGWGRLRSPCIDKDVDETMPTSSSSSTHKNPRLPETITTLSSTTKYLVSTTSLRFTLDSTNQITTIHPELNSKETGATLSLSLLSHYPQGVQWFTTATSALLTITSTNSTTSNGSLWGFSPSSEITSFIRKDSIPCGVLVMLDLLSAEAAPHWQTSDTDDSAEENRLLGQQHMNRFQARLQAERLEATMPPDQARVHRANREMEDRRQQSEQMMAHLAARRAREARRMQDAIVSPRMSVGVVGELCLKWLISQGVVTADETIKGVVEMVLYLLVCQSQRGKRDEHAEKEEKKEEDEEVMPVLKVLEEWNAWAVAGGMKREQVEMLERYRKEFCYAACLVAVVAEASALAGKGKASVDMLECLRMWRKVRLG